MASSGTKLLAARVGLLTVSLGIALAIGEGMAWLAMNPTRSEENRSGREEPLPPDLPVFQGVFDLARANQRGVHKGVVFRSNSHGFRGPEYEPHAEAGTLRILVTGDSVAMGEGVVEDRRYSAGLAERLEGLRGGRYQVINTALSGANAQVAIDRLRNGVEAYGGDLFVYGFTINDIEGPDYVALERTGSEVKAALRTNPFARSRSNLVRFVWWKWLSSYDAPDPREGWYSRELHHNYFENPASRVPFDTALDEYAALAASRGGCGVVLLHTHLADLDEAHPFTDIYAGVAEAARERGLFPVESFAAFEGREAADYWVGFFDPHPNVKGHAILGELLAEGLAALPARCFGGHQAVAR